MRIKVTGTLNDTDEHECECEMLPSAKSDHPSVFILHGGPTGFESFYMYNYTLAEMRQYGWLAGSGFNSWDKLVISKEEMSRVLAEMGV